jgi:hypothetical protein
MNEFEIEMKVILSEALDILERLSDEDIERLYIS